MYLIYAIWPLNYKSVVMTVAAEKTLILVNRHYLQFIIEIVLLWEYKCPV